MAGDPAAAAAAVGAMRPWNYVVTAHKLTVVARSCVGNFTAPDHLDLSKFTRIEIGVSAYSSGSSGQGEMLLTTLDALQTRDRQMNSAGTIT
ncbi:uncharacterized protein [Oryza sativa Japonica Group]|uniref:uncharacterized protein isoform X2 n=1 Tax=Oryza sativa subsp. japonica TaxID=39947 RepID=UPI000E1BE941|nr:uncharacterized protein LOC9267363 isoform X2 [Oryza sativa Japonica Group]